MTDETKTNESTESKADESKSKDKTVGDMPSRRVFDTTEEAAAYLTRCGSEYSDFGKTPLAAPGIDEEGNFDPEVYTDQTKVMVSTLRRDGVGVVAIVVAPIPTVEALLADAAGTEWVEKILHKELNHVAVRNLRKADDIAAVVDTIPTKRDEFITSGRGEGGIMETFNVLFKGINATMGGLVQAWKKRRIIKSELQKAFSSKAYADEYFASLENRGEGKESLFVMALQMGINVAKKKGLDPTIFERWLETRDAKVIDLESEDEDFDIDDLESAMLDSVDDTE